MGSVVHFQWKPEHFIWIHHFSCLDLPLGHFLFISVVWSLALTMFLCFKFSDFPQVFMADLALFLNDHHFNFKW